MFELEGKCALITGASGGIGGSIARALYAQGAKVALSGTRIDPLKALADDLGDRAFIVQCNLSDVDVSLLLLISVSIASLLSPNLRYSSLNT